MISLQSNWPTTTSSPEAAADSRYRSLLQKVLHSTGRTSVQLAITSASPGEGVSTVSANLAMAAVQATGRPTLYIDANFGDSNCQSLFGLERSIGLADILHGAASPDCLQATGVEGLSAISAGTKRRRSSTLISPAAFQRLIGGLADRFPNILVDAPPSRQINSASVCSSLHGVLLVVGAETVRNQVVLKAKQQLCDAGANILGVVFNKRRNHVPNWLYRRL